MCEAPCVHRHAKPIVEAALAPVAETLRALYRDADVTGVQMRASGCDPPVQIRQIYRHSDSKRQLMQDKRHSDRLVPLVNAYRDEMDRLLVERDNHTHGRT